MGLFVFVPFIVILRELVSGGNISQQQFDPHLVVSQNSTVLLPLYALCGGVGCVSGAVRELNGTDNEGREAPNDNKSKVKRKKDRHHKHGGDKKEVHITVKKPQKKAQENVHLNIAVDPGKSAAEESIDTAEAPKVLPVVEKAAGNEDDSIKLTITSDKPIPTKEEKEEETIDESHAGRVVIVAGVGVAVLLSGGLVLKMCGFFSRTTKPMKYKNMKNDDGFFSPEGEACEEDDDSLCKDMYSQVDDPGRRKTAGVGMFDLEDEDEGPFGVGRKGVEDDDDFREIFKMTVV